MLVSILFNYYIVISIIAKNWGKVDNILHTTKLY